MRAPRPALVLSMAALCAAHTYFLGIMVVVDLKRAHGDGPLYSLDHELPPAPLFEISAYRSLRLVAARIPKGARVLLVTSYPFEQIPWEYYFPRREFHFLQDIDIKRLRGVPGRVAAVFRPWYEHCRQYGLLFSADRVAEELARSDYLVEVFLGLDFDRTGLEQIFAHEFTKLYRVTGRRRK
ncbi:MAG: hypothetical protein ACE5F1_03035 [Planctomycetota bacterium]